MKKLRRAVIMLLMILIGFFIQINCAQFVPEISCVPNIILVIVFSIGFLNDSKAGMAAGIISGLLMDIVQGDNIGFYVLIFVYIGFINGVLKRYFISNVILLPLVLCTINEILYHGSIYLISFRNQMVHTIIEYTRHVIIPEYLVTVISSVVIYGIILLIYRKLEKIEKKGETQFV
ncbi:MAG: rod shape-determining protein MreD [Clostridiales bacterium]|nr:rod shape-determining protein MreD [Clostridiales bacterium]